MISTVIVAFSMFSAIPMPQTEWTNKSMRYALCAFPLIGAVIGVLVCLWRFVCLRMEFSEWILAAGICVLPVLVTGGIHLDGFCDTADALASHQDTEKKLQILKDPHMGAFAAIWLGCYFIGQLALAVTAAQMQADLTALAFGYCISRSLSGLAVASFPLAKNSGLAYTFAEYADKKKVRTFLAVLAAVLCVLCCICCGKKGIGVSIAAIGTFVLSVPADWKIRRSVGGPGRMVCPDVRTFHAGSSGTDRVSVVRQKTSQMRSCKWRWRRVVFAGEGKKTGMIYIFGPYAAGKREYVRETFGYTEADFSTKAEDNCRVLYDAQQLASKVGNRPEELEKLAEQLCRKEVVIATETGCGVVPIDAAEREAREAAGRLSILLAKRAQKVIRVWCGLPESLR